MLNTTKMSSTPTSQPQPQPQPQPQLQIKNQTSIIGTNLEKLQSFAQIYAVDRRGNQKTLCNIIMDNIAWWFPKQPSFSFLIDNTVYEYTSVSDHSYFSPHNENHNPGPELLSPKFDLKILVNKDTCSDETKLENMKVTISKIYELLGLLKGICRNID